MKTKIIFFGNGPLSEYALRVLDQNFEIIFHAHDKNDLETVKSLKKSNPDAHGVLASFGVMIKSDVLDLFEPEGILNIHPSLLPKYRGASPIESAILAGDCDFSVSIMKLVKKMDAGPIYHQETLANLPLNKSQIYENLATKGAEWLVKNINSLPEPSEQNEEDATCTEKLDKSMAKLDPAKDTAEQLLRKVVAYQNFPKPKYDFFGIESIILEAHVSEQDELLSVKCKDGKYLSIDRIQPNGRKPMDAKSFLNGYKK